MSDKSKKERAALLFEVTKALVSTAEAAADDRVRLRDAVCAFVFAEQQKGTPLAAMIATIRDILTRAEKEATVIPAHTSRDLARQLVEWCIELQFTGGPVMPGGPTLLS